MTEAISRAEPKISYNPENQTGFGTKMVEHEGEQLKIHDTNNLSQLILAYVINKVGLPDKLIGYSGVIEKDYLHQRTILEEFTAEHPELFEPLAALMINKRLRSLARYREDVVALDQGLMFAIDKSKESIEEEQAREDILLSQAFDLLVPIARQQDSGYDVTALCR